jgi:hypothetical protein
MKFRKMLSDEIEIRVQSISEKGAILLLFKNARVDQDILDETVGPMNWQREHKRENANCIVSIWDNDKKMWVSKEDTGTESYTEKEKGLASDSFKRACFNWGIGRELYTAPFIFVSASKMEIREVKGKLTTYDKFKVGNITYNENKIDSLSIVNQNGVTVYSNKKPTTKTPPKSKTTTKKEEKPKKEEPLLSRDMVLSEAYSKGIDKDEVLKMWKGKFGTKADTTNQKQIQYMLDEIDKIDEFAGTPLE